MGPPLHICVFMCQPFQIKKKKTGRFSQNFVRTLHQGSSATSYFLICTINSNVVDAWICRSSVLAMWNVSEVIAIIKYGHYLGWRFENITTSVVTLDVQNAVFLSFFLSFFRSICSNSISSNIRASTYYTTLPALDQTGSFHTTFVLHSTCYKISCLLFEHLLGPYIRISVTSAACHAVNTRRRECIE